jgi:hypothetical protein
MAQLNVFDSLFDESDDGEFGERYVVTATFKSQFKGICAADETHAYRVGDYVGKLERTDNPFLPVSGVCCNRCVHTITHKKSVV